MHVYRALLETSEWREASPLESKKKFTRISNPALWKKDGPSPMKKYHVLMNTDILVNKIDNPPLNSP
jgi:hypothetical protein